MTVLPRSLLWQRVDTAGVEHALLDDRNGLRARGVCVAAAPLPYTCRYDLVTDEAWAAARLEVTTEGAGWLRNVTLERSAGRWRVTTGEQGDLDRALTSAGLPRAALPGMDDPGLLDRAVDLDLSAALLFNTLPLRRLGIHEADAGTEHVITVGWVLAPSLEVQASEQRYTALGAGRVRFSSAGFAAELTVDAQGYVRHYPGLADRPE